MPLRLFSKGRLAQPNEIDNLNLVVNMQRIERCNQRNFKSSRDNPELFQFFDSQFGHAHTVPDWLDDQPSEKPLLLVRVMVHHPMGSKKYQSTIDIVHPSCSMTALAILLPGYRLAPSWLAKRVTPPIDHGSKFKGTTAFLDIPSIC
jgi:hypothetical protein